MTQKNMILNHLKAEGTITPLQALKEYSVYRLSAVIFELREGHKIDTKQQSSLNRFKKPVRYAKYIYKGVK